ncbi:DMT family transporter [Bradyrhizobium sp. BR 1432]|uniref:DMT family transporter n=1 Tax=Bradyrhizobium sp. BR 1432 TaxID=3447966 RepID=UPI003EE52403
MQAIWIIVGSVLIAVMGACIKLAAAHFTTAEIIFCRSLIGMLCMWGFARWEGVSLRTDFARRHAWRGLVSFGSLAAWFYAVTFLPLATANALISTSSLWIAVFIIAARLLSERAESRDELGPINAWHGLTIVTGFGGVLLLLLPDLPEGQLFAGALGLLSGLLGAVAYKQIIALGKLGEPTTRTVFYFSTTNALGGAVWMWFTGMSGLSWPGTLWLVMIGLVASLGAWCVVRAYSNSTSPTASLLVANLQYCDILFSAILGFLIFEEKISGCGWIGIAMIILSGIGATIIRMRAMTTAPAGQHREELDPARGTTICPSTLGCSSRDFRI